MDGERTVVFRRGICQSEQLVEKLCVEHRGDKVERGVIVG